jgi:peroxiredoxin
MLVPRMPAPDLTAKTLDHSEFDLAKEKPALMTLVCFYRGLHCPVCASYLKELERTTQSLAERGVSTIAISSDGEERARQMADKIVAEHLRVGYGLPLSVARQWACIF